jgi:hypothetical protein
MFRFSIRDLLWLMVVVAVAVGWIGERRHLVKRTEQAERSFDSVLISYGKYVDDPPNLAKGFIGPHVTKEFRDAVDEAKARQAAREQQR